MSNEIDLTIGTGRDTSVADTARQCGQQKEQAPQKVPRSFNSRDLHFSIFQSLNIDGEAERGVGMFGPQSGAKLTAHEVPPHVL